MDWTVAKLTDMATGYWPAALLSAAVELGVFPLLDGEGAEAATVANRLEASPRHTRQLLDALTALGLLIKTGETYRLEPSAVPFLSPAGSTCLLDALRFNTDLYPLWGRLSHCVKEGEPALPPAAHHGANPALTRHFVLGMHSRALAMAPALLPAIGVRPNDRLLDVGAGPGTFSILLAEQHPALQVTVFDLPPILAIAGELVLRSPAADRISFQPGDYRKDSLPADLDSALFCGALHQETPDSAAAIFRKIFAALKPGGRLFVVDMMLAANQIEPAFSALFAVNMMLMNTTSRVFNEPEVRDLLVRTGFAATECARLTACPYWVVTAAKPA